MYAKEERRLWAQSRTKARGVGGEELIRERGVRVYVRGKSRERKKGKSPEVGEKPDKTKKGGPKGGESLTRGETTKVSLKGGVAQ